MEVRGFDADHPKEVKGFDADHPNRQSQGRNQNHPQYQSQNPPSCRN
jgi:hypothetical protein